METIFKCEYCGEELRECCTAIAHYRNIHKKQITKEHARSLAKDRKRKKETRNAGPKAKKRVHETVFVHKLKKIIFKIFQPLKFNFNHIIFFNKSRLSVDAAFPIKETGCSNDMY